MTIADAILTAEEDLGLTQAEIARRLGVYRSYVHRWVNDGDVPRPKTLGRLARLLKMEVTWTGSAFALEKRP